MTFGCTRSNRIDCVNIASFRQGRQHTAAELSRSLIGVTGVLAECVWPAWGSRLLAYAADSLSSHHGPSIGPKPRSGLRSVPTCTTG